MATVADLFAGVEPIDAEELWRAKTHIRIQHLTSSEDAHTRMCRLATQEMYFGRRLEASKVLAQIDAVDLKRAGAFARDYLFRQLSQAHLVVVGPLRHETATRARLRDLLSEFGRNSASRERPVRSWSRAKPRCVREELTGAPQQPTDIERTWTKCL
jgi:predicted Zn-dependent peptidase